MNPAPPVIRSFNLFYILRQIHQTANVSILYIGWFAFQQLVASNSPE